MPLAEDKGLPQAAHAAIAIDKGMDEFEFVVEDAAGDQGMVVGGSEPVEQVVSPIPMLTIAGFSASQG